MAKTKKRIGRKPPKRKTRKKIPPKNYIGRIVASLALLIALVIAAGYVAHLVLRKPSGPTPRVSTPAHPPPNQPKPTYEIYPSKEIPITKPSVKPKVLPSHVKPMVALVIDDMGYDKELARKFADLNAVLTYSILPYSPFQEEVIRVAQSKGFELLLHLPMEPEEYPSVQPGPGALLTSMSPDELIAQLQKNIKAVPDIKGVNNHMGSKLTTVSIQLYQIFSVLKQHNLFFIDSRTTPKTLCEPSARLFQVPFAQRDVFLDHAQDKALIRGQIKKLAQIAAKQGWAVGIGHPLEVTYEMLREELPQLKKKVRLVPASKVVQIYPAATS